MSRAPFAFVLVLLVVALVAIGATSAQQRVSEVAVAPVRYRGLTAPQWAAAYRERTREVQRLRRLLRAKSSVPEAINLAAATYGYSATLWRKANCETGGTFNPYARNNSSSDSPMGLFQFKPSTFDDTPYAGFSIWSPYANALAAGWMHEHGRGGEWQCR